MMCFLRQFNLFHFIGHLLIEQVRQYSDFGVAKETEFNNVANDSEFMI